MLTVDNVFLNQFVIRGLPQSWISPDELYGAIYCFYDAFFTFENKSAASSVVKLQKCFVDKLPFLFG